MKYFGLFFVAVLLAFGIFLYFGCSPTPEQRVNTGTATADSRYSMSDYNYHFSSK